MIVDFQHHYTPPELMEHSAGGALRLDENGNPNYRFNALLADLPAHVRMMDHVGIDMAVLSCGSGFDQPDITVCRLINDRMRQVECDHPGRFIGLAHVPALDPRRVVSTVIRFGLNQKTENIRLLYYLYRFHIDASLEEPELSQLGQVVHDVRKQALAINASNSIGSICALLLASSITGYAGVLDALRALNQTLGSVSGDTKAKHLASLSFPVAYQALLVLAERGGKIATDAAFGPKQFHPQLLQIFNQVITVWTIAKEDPSIFAQFSFPPRGNADPIIVHNWTYGSLAFAKSIGPNQLEQVQSILDVAAENDVLRSGITSGRTARLGADEVKTLTSNRIRAESLWSFYSALGQRLVNLPNLTAERRDDILDALLDQCLRFGPNGLDAAVFLAAGELKIARRRSQAPLRDYLKRLENNRSLRLTLMPFLVAHPTQGT